MILVCKLWRFQCFHQYFEKCTAVFCFKIRIGSYHICGVIVSVTASNGGFKTKTYKIGICCFYANYEALRSKSKTGWLWIRIMCQSEEACLLQTVVSMSSTAKHPAQCIVLYKAAIIIISSKCKLFSPWYSWINVQLAFNNIHLLTHFECSLYEVRYIYFFLCWGLLHINLT